MLKTFRAVTLLAFATSAGFAHAKGHVHKHMIPCPLGGQRATATCVCSIKINGPLLCQKGQRCHNLFEQKCTL